MGFLSSLLPTIVGAGVGVATGNPMMGAAAAGALGYARTGSLERGLMAGLAGYGGAQIGTGLSALGTSEAGANISAAAEAQGEQAAREAMQQQVARQTAEQQAINAAGQSAMTPQALESVATRQAQLNALTPEMYAQSAREAAVNAFTPSAAQQAAMASPLQTGISAALNDPSKLVNQMGGGWKTAQAGIMAASPLLLPDRTQQAIAPLPSNKQVVPYYRYSSNPVENPEPSRLGSAVRYFNPAYTQAETPVWAAANGGMAVEAMSNANAIGQNTGYPQADIRRGAYATPWQTPVSRNMLEGAADTGVDPLTGSMNFARGGISHLGDYSDGGRLLRGPGDGVSDSIPATVGDKQPARLADGEFVIPARIVSELGNGSTEAGARQLYAMMDRVQKARAKTVRKDKVAKRNNPRKLMPA